jgi:hypothetical protein
MKQARSNRRLRIFLRDFRMVEATVNLADGQALASYFASRKTYLNLRGAHWAGPGEDMSHVALRVDQVLWAAAPEGDTPLTSASAPTLGREVELQVDGGLLLRGMLVLTSIQRLSDYLEAAPPFIPVRNARMLHSGRPPRTVNVELGDIVLNQLAIQAAWECATTEPEAPATPRNPLDLLV